MAQIETYTVDTVINNADTVIGSDSANSDVTRNFRMDDISDFVISNIELSDITVVTAAELGILDGATISTAELNVLDGITASVTELNKLDGLTPSTSELNFVDGVTSAIQTQLNGKQSTITGAATTISSSDLTVSRALVSNASGKVVVSTITATEVGHLDGVTSNIQTQLGNIVQFVPTNTGNANQILQRTATGYQWIDASAASFTLTAATSFSLGGVIVPLSSDIDVDSSGNLTLGNISANKITSGVLNVDRIPDVSAAKITSGTIDAALFGDNIGIGDGAIKGTGNTIIIGSDADGTGAFFGNIAIGSGSSTNNGGGVAVGGNAEATGGSFPIAIGGGAKATTSHALVIGATNEATATRSVSVGGSNNDATAENAAYFGGGSGRIVSGENAVGVQASTSVAKQIKLGEDNTYHTYSPGGIRLGADLTAHLLDDYEEGTWTCSDANVTGEQFVKVGRNVTLYGTTTAAVTSATGLPFVPSIGAIGGNASVTTTAISIPATGVFTITYRTAS